MREIRIEKTTEGDIENMVFSILPLGGLTSNTTPKGGEFVVMTTLVDGQGATQSEHEVLLRETVTWTWEREIMSPGMKSNKCGMRINLACVWFVAKSHTKWLDNHKSNKEATTEMSKEDAKSRKNQGNSGYSVKFSPDETDLKLLQSQWSWFASTRVIRPRRMSENEI
jgi:hypothetical protein